MNLEGTAVFDLDGTLIDGDSTTAWISSRVRACWWRILLTLSLAPVALTLMSIEATRRRGASIFLWVASVGMDEGELISSFEEFALVVSAGSARVGWLSEGVDTLLRHIDDKSTVVIATAAPAWLAKALFERKGIVVPLVGSRLVRRFGGWIGAVHCRGEMKCHLLALAGYGTRWQVAYSDSSDDLPLFRGASQVRLINGSERSRLILAKSGIAFTEIRWNGR